MGEQSKPDGIEQLVAAARAGASESVWLASNWMPSAALLRFSSRSD